MDKSQIIQIGFLKRKPKLYSIAMNEIFFEICRRVPTKETPVRNASNSGIGTTRSGIVPVSIDYEITGCWFSGNCG